MTETVRVYTRAELRDPAKRPRVNTSTTFRVAAPRTANPDDDLDSFYAVPSPCCGVVTRVPQYAVDRVGSGAVEVLHFECGKSFWHRRGRGTACRACYRITPVVDAGSVHPAAFDVTWTGV